jgi:fructose-1,6-bisphosphatase/inositol monophosphatase family enzyme
VTVADEEIHRFVIERVRETYPEHGVFGEEGSENAEREYLWLCDPIDGTDMFARGVPVAVFSLALVVDGDPIVGVIYDPFCDKLYSAVKGQGAFCNDQPIHVSDIKLGDKREIINQDVWWVEGLIDDPMPVLGRLYEVSNWPTSIGSVARAAVLVADGGFVATIFTYCKGKVMDVAAGKVIVEEAGGKVTDVFGEDQRYDGDIRGAILSNGVVHDEIVEIFKENVG